MAANEHERMGAKTWICLAIWAVMGIWFLVSMFSDNEGWALIALSLAMLGSMCVTAYGTSDVNKM